MKRNLIIYLVALLVVGIIGVGIYANSDGKIFGRATTDSITLIDAATSTTTGNAFLVKDLRNVVCSVDTANSANLTIKFAGSISDTAPDPEVAQSVSNQWDYVLAVDLENAAALDGDTGLALTGTDDNRQLEIDTNLLHWVIPMITSYTAGTSTVSCVGGGE